MNPSGNDRFGMPDSAFTAALESHGVNNPVQRLGMYVPTRGEVATLPAADLRVFLIDWMWESPSELIPDNTQIRDVRTILSSRQDSEHPDIQQLIAECDAYLAV